MDFNLSKEALEWLQLWSRVAPKELPNKAIIEELQTFNPTETVRLYRFVSNPEIENQKKILAWTSDLQYSLDVFHEKDSLFRVVEVEPSQIISFNPRVFQNISSLELTKRFDIFKEEVITFQV